MFAAAELARLRRSERHVVAMPLIGAGDQGWPADQMLESIFKAAVSWFRRGLPLRALKIVIRGAPLAEAARKHFTRLCEEDENNRRPGSFATDVFLSYSHRDADIAHAVFERLRIARPHACVFYDRRSLAPGASWLMEIAQSLDNARRVVAIYTPDYWSSQYCKDEFLAAYIRQRDTGVRVIYPLYARTASIPYMFRSLQHEDCREADAHKLAAACDAVYDGL
jgi:hypothetical protein